MDYQDYYQTLGVPRDASEKDIRHAYRLLARQCHPDRNPGDKAAEERFKQINEAHEVLTDPEKRRKYDRLGAQWHQWQHMGRDPGDFDFSQWFASSPNGARMHYADPDSVFGGAGGFSDFFQSIFGSTARHSGRPWGRTGPHPRPGRNYEHPVEITLEEAYHGTRRVLEADGSRWEVKIPPGVKTGSKVRIAGKGGPGVAGGAAGDLFLKIRIFPHGTFEREGDNLRCEVPVPLYTAILGGTVNVPTLTGTVQLKIPAETQTGRSFRLRGKGMPLLKDSKRHGDLHAHIRVMLPQKLNTREKELFRELSRLRE
jgi:curved DNA-binding protein